MSPSERLKERFTACPAVQGEQERGAKSIPPLRMVLPLEKEKNPPLLLVKVAEPLVMTSPSARASGAKSMKKRSRGNSEASRRM
jgi:hypothetical protein